MRTYYIAGVWVDNFPPVVVRYPEDSPDAFKGRLSEMFRDKVISIGPIGIAKQQDGPGTLTTADYKGNE